MAEITAGLVMKLRKISGQGMMDCKNALGETNGDLDEALTLLRKKGMATLEKRSGRDTTEGKIVFCKSDNGKTAVLASLCCETDFVAKSDDFLAAAEKLGDYAMACEAEGGAEAILNTAVAGKSFSEVITDTVSKTGEKMEVGEYVRYSLSGEGVIGSYIHFNGKMGAMVEIEANGSAEALQDTANNIAMHITACKPIAVNRDSVDPKVVEQERSIAAEQMKDKPAQIIDKIVEGKMNKFFGEQCLLDQAFVKDEEVTVGAYLGKAAKSAGVEAKIKKFERFAIG